MERRGVIIRFIGRLWMESSPVSSDTKFCPARIPEIRRVGCAAVSYIQEYQQGQIVRESFSVDQDFAVVILDIDAHFAETGDGGKAVSSFQKMGDAVMVPLAREPNMTARWEMDLSPGTVSSPWRFVSFYFHNNCSLNIKFNTAKKRYLL